MLKKWKEKKKKICLGKDMESESFIFNNFIFNNSNEEKILGITMEQQANFYKSP